LVEGIIDRLPTAMILTEEDRTYTMSAEVFGDVIDMWLKNRGNNIKVER
jgi:hypothetical protein